MDFAIWTIITILIVLWIAGLLPKQRQRQQREYTQDDRDDDDVIIIELMDD